MPNIALARFLPDGSRSIRTERVCLDIAVVNALGQGHWGETAAGGGRPCELYAESKLRRNNAESRCADHGLALRPMVFEQQGAMTKIAATTNAGIARAVAGREVRLEADVRSQFRFRLAVVIVRCVAARVARRVCRRAADRPPWATIAMTVANAGAEDAPDEEM